MNEKTRTLTREEIEDIRNRLITRGSVLTDEEAIVLCDMALSAPSQAVTEGDSCATDSERGMRLVGPHGGLKEAMPSPTEVDLADPLFEAIWQATKTWDVNAPEYYKGYCGMNGSHVMLILNALRSAPPSSQKQEGEELDVLRLRNGFMTNPDGSHEPTYGHYVRKSDYDRLRDERDAAVREIKRLVPLECCEGGDPNCYGPRGCLVRAQQAERTPNDVLLARAEKAEAALETAVREKDEAIQALKIAEEERGQVIDDHGQFGVGA